MLTPELTQAIFFYIFAAMVLGGGILTITRRNAVHSAMFLIVSLMGVAGLYLLQQAEFLFAVQIVLYIGGIMVLFLFVIMLVNLDQAAKEKQFNGQWCDRAGMRSAGGSAGVLVPVEGRRAVQDRAARHPARGFAWEIPSNWPTCCSRNICCRSRSLRSCCWWPWWDRW